MRHGKNAGQVEFVRSKRHIKRSLSALLSVIMLFCMGSCAPKKITPSEILKRLLSDLERECVCSTLYDRSELMKDEDSRSFFASLYGETKLPGQLGAADDYAMALSKKDLGFEIQIFHLAHESESRRIEELLQMRIDLLRTVDNRRYLMEEYDTYIASVMIYKWGGYVFLLATGDNDRAIKIIKTIL